MKKIIYCLAIIFVSILTADELEISGTNTIKFGSGTEWAGDDKDIELKKQYLEDWIDIEAVKGDFSAGIRFEAADSSEHNEAISDITKRYFSYSNEDLTITAGDFYSTFGRGLVLDLREEKADFFDNKVTGGRVEYDGDKFSFQALGGKSYFKYINDFDPKNQFIDEMNNTVYGSEGVLNLSEVFKIEDYSFALGGSYLHMEGDAVSETQYLYRENFIEKTEIGAVSFSISAFDIDFYNEYAIKNTFRSPMKRGWANYSSLAYGMSGFGVTFEFKDYYQYGANPNAPVSGFSPYQNGPEVTIDHVSHLLKTHPHEINPNDEIGYKLSLRINPFDDFDLTAIFATASKHEDDKLFPNFDDDYLPYYDSWMDGRYHFGKYSAVLGGGYYYDSPLSKDQNQNVIPGEEGEAERVYTDERKTMLLELGYELTASSALKIAGEYQLVTQEKHEQDPDFNDLYASIEYAYPQFGYINLSFINTSEEVAEDAPESWFGVEAGINILDNHKLELFYGRERAGVKCSGGTCRQVPEFDGFKMTLVSSF